MSSKTNATCKTVATKSDKNTIENKQLPSTSKVPPDGVVLIDNCNTLIEVTVQATGRKRTSTMVSSGHKGVEEKRKPGNSGDSHLSWGRVLREQNKATMKQSLQHFAVRAPTSKSSKHVSDAKDSKKQSHKHLDEIPVKQSVSQKKLEEQIKVTPRTPHPSTTSLPSSVDSILVYDRGAQCGGIFDSNDDRFGAFNPVRTLGFLMKELEDLVKDDKASKILTDMEQVLLRISTEFEKPFVMDSEAIALRTKLEASTLQLEETSRKMNAACETLRNERDSLKRQVHKQIILLNEARERQLDLETTVKTLKQELEEATKTIQTREKTITELKEGMKGHEFSQKIISDLRTNLAEQTELARQRHLEVQYLTLEKDKLSVLCTFKDSLLVELRNSIKELQNQIGDQLSSLNMYVHEESTNPQISLVHGGIACSSPTSTSTRESNSPTSWHDISDVSLSTVGHEPPKNIDQRFMRKPEKITTASESHIGNLAKKRTKNVKESQTKDSVNLEFVSLPCGESSLTLLPSYNDFGYTENSQIVDKGKEDVMLIHKRGDNLRNFKSLSSPPEKLSETKARTEDPLDTQKSLTLHKKQNLEKKSGVIHGSNVIKSNSPHNLLGSSISEQFHNIFHDIRVQSRMPVNVPSPPRNYPHPDWSDSTLPSISTASELNVIPSNET
ncbi:uncharacterized protein LOC116424057 [Nomia melanderi]|uniref:uncharacterized protein LOC116424057 n=1 Tax=Nomia melanderi TaxID=2448451 RepID=UPI001304698F|nr:uncharacterized protein LOC116424057 [Nomia melanderi]